MRQIKSFLSLKEVSDSYEIEEGDLCVFRDFEKTGNKCLYTIEQGYLKSVSFTEAEEQHPIIVGSTTELPSSLNAMPKTNWYWIGGFSTSQDYYSEWPCGYTYPDNIPSFILSGNGELPGSGADHYLNVYLDNHINNVIVPDKQVTIRFYEGSNSHMSVSVQDTSIVLNEDQSVVVVEYNSKYEDEYWDLPSSLYTLSNRHIIWNTNSLYYRVFEGKTIWTP